MVALSGAGIEPVPPWDAIDRVRTVPPDGELVRAGMRPGKKLFRRHCEFPMPRGGMRPGKQLSASLRASLSTACLNEERPAKFTCRVRRHGP